MLPNQISVEIEGIVADRIIVCSSFFSSLVAREKFVVVSARAEVASVIPASSSWPCCQAQKHTAKRPD
jgi:hypothetical protein